MRDGRRPTSNKARLKIRKDSVLPSDCGEHRGQFTDPILSDRGVEADDKVVLVQHVQHNLVSRIQQKSSGFIVVLYHLLASEDTNAMLMLPPFGYN